MIKKEIKYLIVLKEEFLEKYMPAPNADPHGGLEDFIEHDKRTKAVQEKAII